MTDTTLTLIGAACWLTLALTLAAAWQQPRVRAWRRLRENRAAIARAWREWRRRDRAVEDEWEGRE